jgi:hypothetical protein
MANLGDYIGQLMAEITLARLQADLEAVRLADYYANHPLLKAFPVPRFRLPDVTLDFPVAITGVQSPRDGKPLDVAEARRVFRAALDEELDECGVKPTVAERKQLHAVIDRRFRALKVPSLVSTSSVSVADEATNAIEAALPQKLIAGQERAQFIDGLRNRSRVAMLRLLPSPSRVRVITTTADLRELPPQALMRLQLTITEQGVEWRGDSSAKGGGRKLLPE